MKQTTHTLSTQPFRENDDFSYLAINHVVDREETYINAIKLQWLLSHSDLDDAE